MEVECIDFKVSRTLGGTAADYLSEDDRLRPFYDDFPNAQGFKNQIAKRHNSKHEIDRAGLVDELRRQHAGLTLSQAVESSLNNLSNPESVTVTTGHQLNLFTGPLYFVYKIYSAVKLAADLTLEFGIPVVPIYWMASEDHDFEEVQSAFVKGKSVVWSSAQKGAVGRFTIEEVSSALEELKTLYPEGEAGDLVKVFEEAYALPTAAQATRYLVTALFGKHGVITVDGDSHYFKSQVAPVFQKELFDEVSGVCVRDTDGRLQSLGYKPQVFARDINLFYLESGLRKRIERLSREEFGLVDSDTTFSSVDILDLLKTNPERFSPNVILRPVYQEVILPNVAYIGGGAEVSYWLQLKSTFDALEVHFPAVVMRDSFVVLDRKTESWLSEHGFATEDMFGSQ
jgi:bacillithiol biosynthesis cysteine-adding enzyme BshC